ncbi:MAG: hypothetical protein WB048_21950, partial [Pseudolabrys sp.]
MEASCPRGGGTRCLPDFAELLADLVHIGAALKASHEELPLCAAAFDLLQVLLRLCRALVDMRGD